MDDPVIAEKEALRRYQSVRSIEGLEEIAALAARLCRAPAAGITLLERGVPEHRVAFGPPALRETSFCGEVLGDGRALAVSDADEDLRFRGRVARAVRSYAGVPLIAPTGHAVGTLHVVDGRPRSWSESDLDALGVLGRQVIAQLEWRRQRLEKRLSKDALQVVFRGSPLPMFVLDGAGGVRMCNAASEQLFGWTSADMLGAPLPTIPPEGEREFRDMLTRVACRERVNGVEVRRRTRDGRILHIIEFAAPLADASGRVIGAIVTGLDVTERKLAEEALVESEARFRQAQKMEAVGRLAGGVAHDFNNLLLVINGYAELIQSQLLAGDPMGALVEEIASAGRRAAALTRQLLAFSRKEVLQPKRININDLVVQAERMFKRLIGEDIDLKLDVAPKLPRIKVDPGQWEQVMMNLVVNARDAMPKGGTLTIETRSVDLAADFAPDVPHFRAGPHVMLAVRDTGCGMSDEVKAHLFEPFFTTKERGSGTGLGLCTIFGIVKQSSGVIRVETAPGNGTVMRIYAPAVVDDDGSVRIAKAPEPVMRRLTILAVEDDAHVRGLMKSMLRGCGHEVLEAENGLDALAICRQEKVRIDLMITDSVMPGMNGAEVAVAARSIKPGLPILFVSGYTDRGLITDDMMAAFLQKPFTKEELVRRIGDVVERRGPLKE